MISRFRLILMLSAFFLLSLPCLAWTASQGIGKVTLLEGNVSVESAEGSSRPLETGDPVYTGETIISSPESRVRILFVDDTELRVRPSSRITLDEYVFTHEAQGLLFKTSEGAFRVVTGKIVEQNPENFNIQTPCP